jgi:hypothetical protein
MAEATIKLISSPVPGEEPFIGDLLESEVFINTADGRMWSGDSFGAPVELGGAVKNSPIGPLFTSTYLDVELTSPDNLPIANTNPLDIPPGFYREYRILIRFTQNPLNNFSAYFDYPINWGLESLWKPQNASFQIKNPIDLYKAQGRKILIELSSFGPSTEWVGRVLWVSSISQS